MRTRREIENDAHNATGFVTAVDSAEVLALLQLEVLLNIQELQLQNQNILLEQSETLRKLAELPPGARRNLTREALTLNREQKQIGPG